MKKTVVLLAGFAVLLLMFCGSTWGQDKAANVAGTWVMVQQGRSGALNQTLTIKQAGATITGSVKGPNDEIPFTGSVAGNEISLTVKFQGKNGEEIHEYKGIITGGEMKGTMVVGERTVDWSAKRSTS